MLPVIIFDLDGTLINSKVDIASSINYTLSQEGFAPLPQPTIERSIGPSISHLLLYFVKTLTEEEVNRLTQKFRAHYTEYLLDETMLYPGIINFLERFPLIPKTVVTNKAHSSTIKIFKGLNIYHQFRWIIGGDSSIHQKPSPQVLNAIFSDLGEKTGGLIVGDSKIDIDCGKAAGLFTCEVNYGFRPLNRDY